MMVRTYDRSNINTLFFFKLLNKTPPTADAFQKKYGLDMSELEKIIKSRENDKTQK